MRFFRRGSSGPGEPDFGAFWTWWAAFRDPLAEAIEQQTLDERIASDISGPVRSLHPDMAWELGPGRTARHAFCLSPEGDAEKRAVAIRWLATAPSADATWEYHASRQPGQAGTLRIDGVEVDLTEIRAIAGWDDARQRLDIRLWHPSFPSLSEDTRGRVMFLYLDNLLGEDDVERWVGAIEALEAPTGGRTPDELLAELARRRAEADGESWVLAERMDQAGNVAIVMANAALKRIDHPFAHHVLRIALDLGRGVMPDEAMAERLNSAEDALVASLGDGAVYAGRTTELGRRTLYFATADPDPVRAIADGWLRDHGFRGRVQTERDPQWRFQDDLVG